MMRPAPITTNKYRETQATQGLCLAQYEIRDTRYEIRDTRYEIRRQYKGEHTETEMALNNLCSDRRTSKVRESGEQ